MNWPRISFASYWVAAAALSVGFGAGIIVNPQVTFVALVALFGVTALATPASAWVGAALVAALTFKGLVSIGVLPSVATFIDLPLAWGALFVGLLKNRPRSAFLTRHLRWLACLAIAVWLAWAFNPSEILRPVLYLMLLGEPFAIVGALLADPPSPRMRSALELTLLGLVLLQIPVVAIQFAKLGSGDHVQGTLYLAGAGAHVISAICVVGAIWILAGGIGRGLLRVWRFPVAGLLFLIPFIADAKQVLIALPAILLALSWRISLIQAFMRAALVVVSLVALFKFAPAGAQGFIAQAEHGQGGKQAAALLVWQKVKGDPVSLSFGKGPAETVSRAAFMTTDLFQQTGSPLAALGLRPAEMAVQAEGAALVVSRGGGSSFNSGTSSTLGVLGDLGIFGLAAYLGLFLSLFLRLRKELSPEGMAAAAGFALFLVLGVVFDWWEQPPFTIFLGTLAGLSLSVSSGTPRSVQFRA